MYDKNVWRRPLSIGFVFMGLYTSLKLPQIVAG